MGTWGYSAFENDDALDWVVELEESEDIAILEDTFDSVLDSDTDYIDISEASIAIAAAEIVAALLGRAAPSVPEVVTRWISRKQGEIDSIFVEKARNAVNQVVENSELQELWEDSGSGHWKRNVEDLLLKLASPSEL